MPKGLFLEFQLVRKIDHLISPLNCKVRLQFSGVTTSLRHAEPLALPEKHTAGPAGRMTGNMEAERVGQAAAPARLSFCSEVR